MAEPGKLVLAWPFLGAGEIRRIYIFNVNSLEEAEELTNTDHAIQAGSLEMELMVWFCSINGSESNSHDLNKKSYYRIILS